jgi:hypothetical protein
VKDTVQALMPHLETARRRPSRTDARVLPPNARGARCAGDRPPRNGPIQPQLTATALDKAAADNAVSTAEVGTPTPWAARYLRMNGRRRLLGPFNHGTMADALPLAIGAQASHPERQVVALAGDLAFVELEIKADRFVNVGMGPEVDRWIGGDEVLTHPLPLADQRRWALWLIAPRALLAPKPPTVPPQRRSDRYGSRWSSNSQYRPTRTSG